jgi:hypothetical protein
MLLGRVYEVIERCRRSLRYLVPANRFAEYALQPNPEIKKKDVVWFALNEGWPLFAYAGIWTTHGVCEVLSKCPESNSVTNERVLDRRSRSLTDIRRTANDNTR